MGAGQFPAGIGPAGFDPVADPSPPRTTPELSALKFDGASRDWVMLADGRYEAAHPVDQKVALSLLVELGTIASATNIGSKLKKIRPGGASMRAQVTDAINTSFPLSALLANGDVETDAIEIELTTSGYNVAYYYFNLRIDSERTRRRKRIAAVGG